MRMSQEAEGTSAHVLMWVRPKSWCAAKAGFGDTRRSLEDLRLVCEDGGERRGKLVMASEDEDTVTGFLLGGIGSLMANPPPSPSGREGLLINEIEDTFR